MEIPVSKMNRKNVCKNEEIAYKNAKNVDNFQQSKVKESKVKESKVNTTTCSRAREDEKSIICYFWLDPKVTKRSRLRLLRYSLPALRCSHRKLASLKQRCSRSLRSGRSLDAHQPRPILSPASPSASALRITSFLLLFNRIFPFNRIYNPIVLSIRIFNPIIRYHNPSPLRHLRRKILRLYKHPGDSSTQNEAIKPTKLIFNFQFSIQTGLTEEA